MLLVATLAVLADASCLLRLAHVRVEVVEVAQLLCSEPRIRIGGVVSLMVFNIDKDIVLFCRGEERLVVCEKLDRRFGD